MIGQLKIMELRDSPIARLGDRFDIRQFRMVVLDQGALPLSALELAMNERIDARAAVKP